VVGVVLIARRDRNRKRRKAFPASVAFGAASVHPKGLVGPLGSQQHPVILAKRVGAGWRWHWFEVAGNSGKLLNDASIALKRRPFAARFTFQQRKALSAAR